MDGELGSPESHLASEVPENGVLGSGNPYQGDGAVQAAQDHMEATNQEPVASAEPGYAQVAAEQPPQQQAHQHAVPEVPPQQTPAPLQEQEAPLKEQAKPDPSLLLQQLTQLQQQLPVAPLQPDLKQEQQAVPTQFQPEQQQQDAPLQPDLKQEQAVPTQLQPQQQLQQQQQPYALEQPKLEQGSGAPSLNFPPQQQHPAEQQPPIQQLLKQEQEQGNPGGHFSQQPLPTQQQQQQQLPPPQQQQQSLPQDQPTPQPQFQQPPSYHPQPQSQLQPLPQESKQEPPHPQQQQLHHQPPHQPAYASSPARGKRPADDGSGEHFASPAHKRQAVSPAPGQLQGETVLRLLVNVRRVGSVIGKAGSIVKQIRDETGCRMRVVEGVPGCDERVVVISSKNDHTMDLNPAQQGLLKAHARAVEGMDDGPPNASGQPPSITSRMLVCHTQAGSIIGKAGKIIKDIRDESGAHIKILPPEDIPMCALSNDRVVQLMGSVDQLQRALALVSRQIRDNPPKERPGGPPASKAAPAPASYAPPAYQGAPSGGYQAPPQPSYQARPASQQAAPPRWQ